MALLPANGGGTFRAARSDPSGPSPALVAPADLAGDGRLDIITANASTDVLGVMMNLGGGQFAPPVNDTGPQGTPTGLVVGDFDGDGPLDVAITITGAPDEIVAFAGDGDGTFRYDDADPTGLGACGLAGGPVFGPGRTDLASGTRVGTTIDLFKANGAPAGSA